MKKQALTALTVTVLLLAGCGDNADTGTENDTRVPLRISGGIDLKTRAHDKTWDAGDAIGIYMTDAGTVTVAEGAANRKYVTAQGDEAFKAAESQTIYFPINGDKVDFLAYYPFEPALTDGALTIDVSNQTAPQAIDLMTAWTVSTAEKPLDKEHYEVSLNFTHRLTKLCLTIAAGNGISLRDLEGLKVEITNQRTEGSYAPLSEVFGVASEPIKTVVLRTAADGTAADAILIPTTEAGGINPIVAGRQLVFTLAGTGEIFRWPVPDDKAFNQGDKNIYDITINRTGLDVTATIKDWNEGNGGGEPGSAE
ncbi:fimbrillin family protein [Parabacteroides pacaensis]|uniref:fimbrillin family protein n=1 Tax=Parabacteroides pacaensis TaxID=2086575 RepID=UPI00131D77A0|nr:fimbrillin family protein [Parabacteroides pacaensis]